MADREHGPDFGEDGQPVVLHPIGRALRATYDADNHDSLDSKLTGLMLELARVEDPPSAPSPASPPPALSASPAPAPPSWLRRLFGFA